MVSVAQAVDHISEATNWPLADLKQRARLCVKAGLLPKGLAGRGGTGAAEMKAKHFVTLILSLACPKAKFAPKYIKTLKKLKRLETEEWDGTVWTLQDALLDRIKFWDDPERILSQAHRVDRLLLLFDEHWPTAELDFSPMEGDGKSTERRLFAPKVGKKGIPHRKIGDTVKAVAINGGIFLLIADILAGREREIPAASK